MATTTATDNSYDDDFKYLQGFGSHFQSEAVKGALPKGQNSPQKCPLGLYAEQLTGTAFTAPRVFNQRSWLYRIRPSVTHKPFQAYKSNTKLCSSFSEHGTPQQYRWMPPKIPTVEETKRDFVDGLFTVAGAGSAQIKHGFAIHMWTANSDMTNRALCNADGDFLFVPQQGSIVIRTEMGMLLVAPGEIAVVPRGIRFSIALKNGPSRGYIAEIFTGHFTIPDLGPIGSNCLANPRDFCYPVASYEDVDVAFELVHKYQGKLFVAAMDHSCFDVVAWHGNYAPYKYNLKYFNAVNSVTFDHPDPSIYTVLTCPSSEYGTAIMDFVIFPPRWTVADHTFRPPWFHRNTMNEYMGLVYGKYEAKEKGFVPGGSSLHNCMSSHGPEVQVFENASNATLKAERIADNTLAFMFETNFMINPTPLAIEGKELEIDQDYYQCWQGFKKYFVPPQ